MVTLQVIERCTPSGESPEFIDNTFVPGVDIFVIAVVKLEKVAENEDPVGAFAHVPDEISYECVAGFISSGEMGVGKKDRPHATLARYARSASCHGRNTMLVSLCSLEQSRTELAGLLAFRCIRVELTGTQVTPI